MSFGWTTTNKNAVAHDVLIVRSKEAHYPDDLSAPKLKSAVSVNNGIKISWEAVKFAEKYRVFYLGASGVWRTLGDTASTSFLDDDVRSGSSYTYTVRPLSTDGEVFTGAYDSRGISAQYDPPLLATPQITKLESTTDGVKITWNKVSGAFGYRVFYLGRYGWTGMDNVTSNSYLDTDVSDGGTYTYTVRCIDQNGNFVSRYNSDGRVYTYKKPWLATPGISSLRSTDNGVEIQWNKISGAEKYCLFYLNASGVWRYLGETTETSFLDDDVRSGSTYTYTVRCIDAAGDKFTSLYDTAGKSIRYVSDKAEFINYLMNHIDSWAFNDSIGMMAQSGFTFMDLDFDGVNEFIVQRHGGTMCNFDAVVYTYKNGRVTKVSGNEEFIQNYMLNYYYNTITKKYEIHGKGILAAGTLNDHTRYDFTLSYANGRITTDYYACEYDIYPMHTGTGRHEYHYYDGAVSYYDGIGSHREITEEQYNAIKANKLKNCVDCHVNRQFIYQYEWNVLSAAQKRQQMLDAYNAFSYDLP